jgi:glycosyltransferase involved in cell wall biosynthesis
MESRILALADRVAATSPDYLQTSAALAPYRDKCRVIPLGLDPARLEAAGAKPEWMPKRSFGATVLSVGRFTYYKGFEHLVRAAARLEDTCLVIAGKGPLKDNIRKLADDLGLSGRIIMPGEVEDRDLAWLYENCDAFCLPSVERTEAFGMVLLEAMSRGLPLVTAAVPGSGMNFVNLDGETGLIAPPADHKALASALREVLKPGVRESMSRSCRRRFADHFHIDPVRRKLDEVYEDVLR